MSMTGQIRPKASPLRIPSTRIRTQSAYSGSRSVYADYILEVGVGYGAVNRRAQPFGLGHGVIHDAGDVVGLGLADAGHAGDPFRLAGGGGRRGVGAAVAGRLGR